MAALVGGLISLVLGIIGIIIWWGYFVKALAAGIPALLIKKEVEDLKKE